MNIVKSTIIRQHNVASVALYKLYVSMVAIAMFVLFGPLALYLDRAVETVVGLILLSSAAGIIVILGLLSKRQFNVNLIVVILLLVVSLIDIFINNLPYDSFLFLLPYVEFFLFFVCLSASKNKQFFLNYLSFLFFLKALVVLYMYLIGQFYDFHFQFSEINSIIQIGGILFQRPIEPAISLYTIVALYMSLKAQGYMKAFYCLLTILCIIITILSFSRSLIAPVVLLSIYLLLKEHKWKVLIIGVLSLGLFSFIVLNIWIEGNFLSLFWDRFVGVKEQMNSDLGRLRLYEMSDAWDLFLKGNWLVGIGASGSIETFKSVDGQLLLTHKQYIHNYHMLILVKLGLIGVILIYGFLLSTLYRASKLYSYCLIAMLSFLVFQPIVLSFHLFGLMGLLYVVSQNIVPACFSVSCRAGQHSYNCSNIKNNAE